MNHRNCPILAIISDQATEVNRVAPNRIFSANGVAPSVKVSGIFTIPIITYAKDIKKSKERSFFDMIVSQRSYKSVLCGRRKLSSKLPDLMHVNDYGSVFRTAVLAQKLAHYL